MPPERESEIVRAFIIGGLIGVAAGMFLAAKGGRETLQVLIRRADAFLTRVQGDYEKAAKKAEQTFEFLNRCREGMPTQGKKT